MGKITPPKLPWPKSKCAAGLLIALALLAITLFAAAAWQLVLLAAVLATIGRAAWKLWKRLDGRFQFSKRLRKWLERFRPRRRTLRLALIAAMVPLAVMLFIQNLSLMAGCFAAVGAVWLCKRIWKRARAYALSLREDGFHFVDLSFETTYVIYVIAALMAATATCVALWGFLNDLGVIMQEKYDAQSSIYTVPDGGEVRLEPLGSDTYRMVIVDAYGRSVNSMEVDLSSSSIEYAYCVTDAEEGAFEDGASFMQPEYTVIVQPLRSDLDHFFISLLKVLMVVCIPLVYVGTIAGCAILFFRNKLKTPIALLSDAAQRISENSLDFSVRYAPRDEMGQLCDSFEQMRAALAKNYAEMWRQMDERRRLNAAFAHDLRTPLTVLKGHADMLKTGVPDGSISREEIAQEVAAMSAHIERLENYVGAMSRLQRLEDVEIHALPVDAKAFEQSLRETAEILCSEKRLDFSAEADCDWNVDAEAVFEVFENLLSNAARFASKCVRVRIESAEGALIIEVSDDGAGFTPDGLRRATDPFYRSGQQETNHLGLGLNICRILCERHGGGVEVQNGENGGGCVRARFAME